MYNCTNDKDRLETNDRPDPSSGMMMMEAARTSETSVDNYFTRQYIP